MLSSPPSQLVDGSSDPLQTHPELVSESGGATFDIAGEFWTHSPLPEIRYTLRQETKGLFSDDKIIAKVTEKHSNGYTTTLSNTSQQYV